MKRERGRERQRGGRKSSEGERGERKKKRKKSQYLITE